MTTVVDGAPSAAPAKDHRATVMSDRFRRWRERVLPKAAYRIEPRFWTPAGIAYAKGLPPIHYATSKSFEPRVTGLAYTARRLYLVVAAVAAGYQHVAQLIHARDLIRADPDYAEHHAKRVTLILLCDSIEPPVADFARRHRVRVITRAID